MIVLTKMPYEVPNDVIVYHEKRIEWNILISACMPNVCEPVNHFCEYALYKIKDYNWLIDWDENTKHTGDINPES